MTFMKYLLGLNTDLLNDDTLGVRGTTEGVRLVQGKKKGEGDLVSWHFYFCVLVFVFPHLPAGTKVGLLVLLVSPPILGENKNISIKITQAPEKKKCAKVEEGGLKDFFSLINYLCSRRCFLSLRAARIPRGLLQSQN